MPLATAQVEAKVEGSGARRRVTLPTDKPAVFVWADVRGSSGGDFDDNCLTLLPGRARTIGLNRAVPGVKVTHLRARTE